MTQQVQPIPPQYASAVPYLIVPDAAQAIALYEQAFGAIELYRLTGPGGFVVHAELRIGAALFLLGSASDAMGAHAAAHFGGTPVTVCIYVEDVDALVHRARAAGCTVLRPPADQFYGARSALITDPFGLRWNFATQTQDVSTAEMQARLDTMFAERR